MQQPDPNAPVMNFDEFFGGGISLAQYERKDDPLVQQKHEEQAQASQQDLISMDPFAEILTSNEPQEGTSLTTKTSDGSDGASASNMHTDFLDDEEIGFRDHSEARILAPIANPQNSNEQPKIALVRNDEDDFLKSSKVWRCLSCLHLGEYSKYFNVTTKEVKERLKYTLYGHFTGMQRPSFINEQAYSGLAAQSQDQLEKPDFDLYAPFWLMITLVVECSIIGLLNRYVNAYWAGDYDTNNFLNVQFSVTTVTNLLIFLSVFFIVPPLAIYFFARMKLLDGTTKFWRLFAALGYSYASYVPAILLTIIGISLLKWIFIGVACGNQLFGLYKQSDHLVPMSQPVVTGNSQANEKQLTSEERQKLVLVMRICLLASQLIFAFFLKTCFVL